MYCTQMRSVNIFFYFSALVHDLAECIVGDLTPHCGVTPEEKHRREDEAMKKIAELTGMAGDRMYDLYKVSTIFLYSSPCFT